MDEPSLLTVAEQVVAAELAYYHQRVEGAPTAADQATWQHRQAAEELLLPLPAPVTFGRHVLERHGYSLHRFMATHLSPGAWRYWLGQRGLLIPF